MPCALKGEQSMPKQSNRGRLLAALFAATLFTVSHPAAAQSLVDLDLLVQGSAKPADGLALARSQAAGGAFLDALATLDRVLAIDPKHKQAKLLHASLLCRIDDADGASLEFGRLKKSSYKKAEWAEAIAPCKKPEGAA